MGSIVSSFSYTYTIDFSLNDEINIDSFGDGQTNSVVALFNQQFPHVAGANCEGSPCEGIKAIDGNITTGLSCPVDLCEEGGQVYQLGTSLPHHVDNYQESNCVFADPPPNEDNNDHVVGYNCNETNSLNATASAVLSYVACTANGFDISFPIIDDAVLNFSTTQGAQYVLVGQIFIDNLAPRPLYAGYAGIAGDTTISIAGLMNVVIDRTIGYVNQNNECVAS